MNAVQALQAIAANRGHLFFDKNMNPVSPVEGQWFCEVDIDEEDQLRFEAMVEFNGVDESGRARVTPDGHEFDRYPDCYFLLLQA
jgi:hypothetical protein